MTGWSWGTAMRAVKFWGFTVTLRSFFQVSITSSFMLLWLHLWVLNFSQCTEDVFLLCTIAGGGASAPAIGNDMEEDIGKHQFRKEVQELGLGGGRVQDGHHTLDLLFLPRSLVCLSKIDSKCDAYFSSWSFF